MYSSVLLSPPSHKQKEQVVPYYVYKSGIIYAFQQKGTTLIMFQGKRSYRGTEFLSTGYCTWNPIPQELSSVKTGPLLDVSVLPEAETY